MSSPVGPDNNGIDDPLLYAPRWARNAKSQPPAIADPPPHRIGAAPPTVPPDAPIAAPTERAPTDRPPMDGLLTAPIVAPPMAPGIGGPNIELPPRQRPFAGDVAIRDLRRRLSLDPDLVPQPPQQSGLMPALPWIGRFAFVLASAAIVAFAITLVTVQSDLRKSAIVGTVTPLIEDWARQGGQPIRLLVESQRGFANEPLPLGVALNEAAGAEMLTLVGLASGTKLSAGTPLGLTGWQVPARDLGKAFAYAPKDFVGVMDAAVDLRSPRDRLMDSQIVRLEWVQKKEKEARLMPKLEPTRPEPAKPVVQPLDPEEIAMLVKRAEDFLKIGDIAAARLALRRAANSGHAPAALALGMTFDPFFLAEQGVLGFAAEPAQARSWYERAAELGSSEAPRRLERLAGPAK
jgi:hypothetical protein